jgi:predicted nucleotidyltransferase component of viral defense system
MNIFDNMLSRYEIRTNDDYTNALHEVMQQVALAGLYRGGFFDKAAFYGGTCLRIFHKLERFSEDMDFSLLEPNLNFKLEKYFDSIVTEFKALGREVVINKKEKKNFSTIESAFLKEDTAVYNLQFRTERSVKIKIEVDINPPLGFGTESKLLLMPFSFMPRCYTLPSLYAGKIHALLFRKWNNRVKGRDWYDFEWYVRNNVPLDFAHFCERTRQFENTIESALTPDELKQLLKKKIANTNIELVKADVRPFIKNIDSMNLWSADYFSQLVDMIVFV